MVVDWVVDWVVFDMIIFKSAFSFRNSDLLLLKCFSLYKFSLVNLAL